MHYNSILNLGGRITLDVKIEKIHYKLLKENLFHIHFVITTKHLFN